MYEFAQAVFPYVVLAFSTVFIILTVQSNQRTKTVTLLSDNLLQWDNRSKYIFFFKNRLGPRVHLSVLVSISHPSFHCLAKEIMVFYL